MIVNRKVAGKWVSVRVDGPSVSQIEALSIEAGAAGDLAQVRLCDLALRGNRAALDKCAEILDAAVAQ